MDVPSKRRRVPPAIYNPPTAQEDAMIQRAMSNSLKDKRRDSTYTLTEVRGVAERYGICKIVPPDGWKPPFSLNVDCPKRFQTKDQSIHRLEEGISFGDGKE
eukprot:scaffold59548_cov62-Cyclotella_meneghiniana.AAC.5